MWARRLQALAEEKDSVPGLLLGNRIELYSGTTKLSFRPMSLATGAMSYQVARRASQRNPIRLIACLPSLLPSDAHLQVSSVLFSDLYARKRDLGRPLLVGDVLLITRNLREAVSFLESLNVAKSVSLVEVWKVGAVSAYETVQPNNEQARVWVANPAHKDFLHGFRDRFSAVIVDGSHLSVRERIADLMSIPSIAEAPIQIVLVPPCAFDMLPSPSMDTRNLFWLWDLAAESSLDATGASYLEERYYWVCDDDVVDPLMRAHDSLLHLTRMANRGAPMEELAVGWALYHRLRTLSVPLSRLEELRLEQPFLQTLRSRIRVLEVPPKVPASFRPTIDVYWPALHDSLREAYERLRGLSEPPKFWAIAQVVEESFHRDVDGALTIVMPSRDDAALLGQLLCDLLDEARYRLEEALLRFITVQQERAIPVQGPRLLPGMRRSSDQYLDVYPHSVIHVTVYPYECNMDQKRVDSTYRNMTGYQDDDVRNVVLDLLGFPTSTECQTPVITPTPKFNVRECTAIKVRENKELDFEPFTIEWRELEASIDEDRLDRIALAPSYIGEVVEIILDGGEVLHLPPQRHVYVYYAADKEVRTPAAGSVRVGDNLIVLADDLYEDLFERVVEALDRVRPADQTIKLQFWSLVKTTALSRSGGRRRDLYEQLRDKGLGVDYSSVTTWFREGEGEIIAPQQFRDFTILIDASGLVSEPKIAVALWSAVQEERINRRQLGHHLHRALAALFSGSFDRNVLCQVPLLESTVEDVVNLVIIRRVQSVRRITK